MTHHLLANSGQSLASNGQVVDSRDLNLEFGHTEATHNKLFLSIPPNTQSNLPGQAEINQLSKDPSEIMDSDHDSEAYHSLMLQKTLNGTSDGSTISDFLKEEWPDDDCHCASTRDIDFWRL
ncbi:hypothetical protein TNCV_2798851 [Trichonephila clavipes]|nr:hypothetical protein TNCV_2798851 [Trichonephila clavipes]